MKLLIMIQIFLCESFDDWKIVDGGRLDSCYVECSFVGGFCPEICSNGKLIYIWSLRLWGRFDSQNVGENRKGGNWLENKQNQYFGSCSQNVGAL